MEKENPPVVTEDDLCDFVAEGCTPEMRKRIVALLQDPQSYASRCFDRLRIAAEHPFDINHKKLFQRKDRS